MLRLQSATSYRAMYLTFVFVGWLAEGSFGPSILYPDPFDSHVSLGCSPLSNLQIYVMSARSWASKGPDFVSRASYSATP